MNIILIGAMGSGKTSVGSYLANVVNYKFFDSDIEITKQTKVSINYIFKMEGEQGFRLRETKMLKTLCKKTNIVLATGGGCVIKEENRKILKDSGFVIYLYSTIETLVKRTMLSQARPLLQHSNNVEKTICDLLAKRKNLYKQIADVIINTTDKKIYNIVKEIQNIIVK